MYKFKTVKMISMWLQISKLNSLLFRKYEVEEGKKKMMRLQCFLIIKTVNNFIFNVDNHMKNNVKYFHLKISSGWQILIRSFPTYH